MLLVVHQDPLLLKLKKNRCCHDKINKEWYSTFKLICFYFLTKCMCLHYLPCTVKPILSSLYRQYLLHIVFGRICRNLNTYSSYLCQQHLGDIALLRHFSIKIPTDIFVQNEPERRKCTNVLFISTSNSMSVTSSLSFI